MSWAEFYLFLVQFLVGCFALFIYFGSLYLSCSNYYYETVFIVFSVTFFSVFIGSQITEGLLLVPYWQSLSSVDFYSYYANFGPSIGQFYTVLTIAAAVIPIIISIYCKSINSNALNFALVSSFLALLFVAAFYIYFKEANELFYQTALNETELKKTSYLELLALGKSFY